MENFIKYVKIHNFKSIANLELEDCRRINLFIGYPNVGKSNVLEALGLFSVPFLNEGENLNKLVRVENKNELFYDVSKKINIITNIAKIQLDNTLNLEFFRTSHDDTIVYSFSKDLENQGTDFDDYEDFWQLSNIMRYNFKVDKNWFSIGEDFLLPPFGENLIDVLSYNLNVSKVKDWIKQEFKKSGLEYVIDKGDNSLKVQRRLNEDEVFTLPYSSMADTLQRLIFYRTAIASNENSVLLFEEPEAHAFPPYIKNITQDIIDAKTNQFFVATHSPFIVNDFLEYANLRKEVAIYLFDFKNNQTVVKRLTDNEIDEVYNYGIDLFFNIESFLNDE